MNEPLIRHVLHCDPVFLQNGNLKRLSNLEKKKFFLKKNILNHLYQKGSVSNPEICKLTHMSSPSIHKLIGELIDEKLVREEGIGESIGGRKPNLYGLRPDSRFIVGIKIGRKSADVAIFNICNQIVGFIHSINRPLESNKIFVNDICHFVASVISNSGIDETKILGIGIGLPGLTDPNTGNSFTHLNHSQKSVRQLFEEKFEKPVFIDNDARVMALGEYAFGLAKGKSNVLCLNLSSGIGMGMILNGILYHGNSGFAGEFGHIQVEEEGLLCGCGKRGCLETIASGNALERMAREAITRGKATTLTALVNGKIANITTKMIVEAARLDDQFSIHLLSIIGKNLGKGLATLINIFNPEAIILGGKIARAGHFIINPIQQTLNKLTIDDIKNDTAIYTSNINEKSAVMGAIALVMENIFLDVKYSVPKIS